MNLDPPDIGLGRQKTSHHCLLCGVSLSTYLDEIPCPHWFVVPGRRGFRLEKLARVFEVFDLGAVIAYLRELADGVDKGEAERGSYREWVEQDQVHTVIHWRRRKWAFSYGARTTNRDGAVSPFQLATYYDGALIEEAVIELHGAERKLKITDLIRHAGKAVA